MSAKQTMTADQLKGLDWASLIQKFGPVFALLIQTLLDQFKKKESQPTMQSAAPAHCPHDVVCCCQEAMHHSIAAAMILAECCCCEEET